MNSEEKIVQYEMQIEDMLHILQERLNEFKENGNLSEFEQGRQLAYIEMMDIINTRYQMIMDEMPFSLLLFHNKNILDYPMMQLYCYDIEHQ